MTGIPYRNRREAGRMLAAELRRYRFGHPLVLALPRGGVPVGFEVARALATPLDVLVVRKLGVPGREELAMGAIAPGPTVVLNADVVKELRISQDAIDAEVAREEAELSRRETAYRDGRPPLAIAERDAIVVDDGLATGASMRVAVEAIRELAAASTTVAVPVAARETCNELLGLADRVVCLALPQPFYAVGEWYIDFRATSDKEVRELLAQAGRLAGSPER